MGQSINRMSRAISLTTIIIIIIIIVIIIIIIVIIILLLLLLLLLLLFYYFIIIMKFFMFYIISFLQIAYGFCIGALFKWYPVMILWFFSVCGRPRMSVLNHHVRDFSLLFKILHLLPCQHHISEYGVCDKILALQMNGFSET